MSIESKIERRQKIRENHELIFEKIKEKFDKRNFPMEELNERILECAKYEAFHYTDGKEKHRTNKLKLYEPQYEFFGIDWSYEYCDTCNKVLNRRGVLTNQIDNTAYIRKFDGEVKNVETHLTQEDLVAIFDGRLEV